MIFLRRFLFLGPENVIRRCGIASHLLVSITALQFSQCL